MRKHRNLISLLMVFALLLTNGTIAEASFVDFTPEIAEKSSTMETAEDSVDATDVAEPIAEPTDEAVAESVVEPTDGEDSYSNQEPVASTTDEQIEEEMELAAPSVIIAPEWEYDAEIGAITIPYVELPETLTFEWSFAGEAVQYAVQIAPVPEEDKPEQRGERIYTTEPRIELPAANYAEGGWFSLYVTAVLEDGEELEGWKYFRMERREASEQLQMAAFGAAEWGKKIPNSIFYEPIGDRHCSEPYGGFIPYRSISASANVTAHLAQDYWTNYSTVTAIYPGKVCKVNHSPASGAGRYIVIEHSINGVTVYSEYQHLLSIQKNVGDTVEGGEPIAVKGGSGYGQDFYPSYGANGHLHLIILTGECNLWTNQFSEYTDEFGETVTYGVNQEKAKKASGEEEAEKRPYLIRNNTVYYNPESILNGSFTIGPRITEIKLEDVTIPKDKTQALNLTILPSDAGFKKLKWISSNPGIVAVSSDGTITGVGNGTATITCRAQDGSGVSASCQVTVVDFQIDPAEITLGVGQTATLVAKQGEKKTSSTFSTSDNSIVSITKDKKDKAKIKITAKGTGSATIIATTKDGKTAICQVTVKPAPEDIEITPEKTTLNIGESIVPEIKMYPADAIGTITWSLAKSNDKKYISLDKTTGKITAKKDNNGKVTVSIKCSFGKKKPSKTIQVTVVDPTRPTDIAMSIDGVTPLEDGNYRVVYVDETFTPKPILYPNTAESKLEWKSSNTKIATVKNGVITPKKKGRAKITVWPKKTGKKVSANIYVDVEDPCPPKKIYGLKSYTLGVGEKWKLMYTLEPSNARTQMTFKSSKSSVATVDASGMVTAKKKGTTTITAKTHNGKSIKCKITVKKAGSGLQMERETLSLHVGDTYLLSVFAVGGQVGSITFSSSDSRIVSIDEEYPCGEAEITALREGTCVISAKSTMGFEASCLVTVEPAATPVEQTVTIEGDDTVTLMVGEVRQFKAKVTPADAKTKLTWSMQSGASKIVVMDRNGCLTALRVGTAIIKASTSNGKSDTVTINVVENSAGEQQAFDNDILELINQVNLLRGNEGIYSLGISSQLFARAEEQLDAYRDSNKEFYSNSDEIIGSTVGPVGGDLTLKVYNKSEISAIVMNTNYTNMGIAVIRTGLWRTATYVIEFE